MGRVIAIGDIHGCSKALEALLNAIAPVSDDILIPLGDVVDRGPDPKRTVALLLGLRDVCQLQPIMGNHEEMMLEVLLDGFPPHAWIQYGGISTLDSYGFSGDLRVIPEQHVDFLRSFLSYFETETHFFVHANYDPALPMEQQSPRVLRWTSLNNVLPSPHCSKKIAVVGHTAERSGEIFSMRHIKCIDTYCYGGKWLTALDVVSSRVWQSNEQGEIRS